MSSCAEWQFLTISLLSPHHFELLHEVTLLCQSLLKVFQTGHFFSSYDKFVLGLVFNIMIFLLLLFFGHQMCALLLVLLDGSLANFPQSQVILQPLILVLVVDEVSEQFPVSGGVL